MAQYWQLVSFDIDTPVGPSSVQTEESWRNVTRINDNAFGEQENYYLVVYPFPKYVDDVAIQRFIYETSPTTHPIIFCCIKHQSDVFSILLEYGMVYCDEEDLVDSIKGEEWSRWIVEGSSNHHLSSDDVIIHKITLFRTRSQKMPLPELNLQDMYTYMIQRNWNTDAGVRTILYYSCLLNNKSADELPSMVSLPDGTFKEKIRILHDNNIIDRKTYHLISDDTHKADEIVAKIILNEMGGEEWNPLYNGVTIYNATRPKRYELWCEAPIKHIQRLWGDIDSIDDIESEFVDEDDSRIGKYVVIKKKKKDYPPIIIMFLNMQRMQNESEGALISDLIIEYQREHQIATVPVGIIAAPTYAPNITHKFTYTRPHHLIGPINFASLMYFFENRTEDQKKTDLDTFFEYFKMRERGGGILISSDLIGFLEI